MLTKNVQLLLNGKPTAYDININGDIVVATPSCFAIFQKNLDTGNTNSTPKQVIHYEQPLPITELRCNGICGVNSIASLRGGVVSVWDPSHALRPLTSFIQSSAHITDMQWAHAHAISSSNAITNHVTSSTNLLGTSSTNGVVSLWDIRTSPGFSSISNNFPGSISRGSSNQNSLNILVNSSGSRCSQLHFNPSDTHVFSILSNNCITVHDMRMNIKAKNDGGANSSSNENDNQVLMRIDGNNMPEMFNSDDNDAYSPSGQKCILMNHNWHSGLDSKNSIVVGVSTIASGGHHQGSIEIKNAEPLTVGELQWWNVTNRKVEHSTRINITASVSSSISKHTPSRLTYASHTVQSIIPLANRNVVTCDNNIYVHEQVIEPEEGNGSTVASSVNSDDSTGVVYDTKKDVVMDSVVTRHSCCGATGQSLMRISRVYPDLCGHGQWSRGHWPVSELQTVPALNPLTLGLVCGPNFPNFNGTSKDSIPDHRNTSLIAGSKHIFVPMSKSNGISKNSKLTVPTSDSSQVFELKTLTDSGILHCISIDTSSRSDGGQVMSSADVSGSPYSKEVHRRKNEHKTVGASGIDKYTGIVNGIDDIVHGIKYKAAKARRKASSSAETKNPSPNKQSKKLSKNPISEIPANVTSSLVSSAPRIRSIHTYNSSNCTSLFTELTGANANARTGLHHPTTGQVQSPAFHGENEKNRLFVKRNTTNRCGSEINGSPGMSFAQFWNILEEHVLHIQSLLDGGNDSFNDPGDGIGDSRKLPMSNNSYSGLSIETLDPYARQITLNMLVSDAHLVGVQLQPNGTGDLCGRINISLVISFPPRFPQFGLPSFVVKATSTSTPQPQNQDHLRATCASTSVSAPMVGEQHGLDCIFTTLGSASSASHRSTGQASSVDATYPQQQMNCNLIVKELSKIVLEFIGRGSSSSSSVARGHHRSSNSNVNELIGHIMHALLLSIVKCFRDLSLKFWSVDSASGSEAGTNLEANQAVVLRDVKTSQGYVSQEAVGNDNELGSVSSADSDSTTSSRSTSDSDSSVGTESDSDTDASDDEDFKGGSSGSSSEVELSPSEKASSVLQRYREEIMPNAARELSSKYQDRYSDAVVSIDPNAYQICCPPTSGGVFSPSGNRLLCFGGAVLVTCDLKKSESKIVGGQTDVSKNTDASSTSKQTVSTQDDSSPSANPVAPNASEILSTVENNANTGTEGSTGEINTNSTLSNAYGIGNPVAPSRDNKEEAATVMPNALVDTKKYYPKSYAELLILIREDIYNSVKGEQLEHTVGHSVHSSRGKRSTRRLRRNSRNKNEQLIEPKAEVDEAVDSLSDSFSKTKNKQDSPRESPFHNMVSAGSNSSLLSLTGLVDLEAELDAEAKSPGNANIYNATDSKGSNTVDYNSQKTSNSKSEPMLMSTVDLRRKKKKSNSKGESKAKYKSDDLSDTDQESQAIELARIDSGANLFSPMITNPHASESTLGVANSGLDIYGGELSDGEGSSPVADADNAQNVAAFGLGSYSESASESDTGFKAGLRRNGDSRTNFNSDFKNRKHKLDYSIFSVPTMVSASTVNHVNLGMDWSVPDPEAPLSQHTAVLGGVGHHDQASAGANMMSLMPLLYQHALSEHPFNLHTYHTPAYESILQRLATQYRLKPLSRLEGKEIIADVEQELGAQKNSQLEGERGKSLEMDIEGESEFGVVAGISPTANTIPSRSKKTHLPFACLSELYLMLFPTSTCSKLDQVSTAFKMVHGKRAISHSKQGKMLSMLAKSMKFIENPSDTAYSKGLRGKYKAHPIALSAANSSSTTVAKGFAFRDLQALAIYDNGSNNEIVSNSHESSDEVDGKESVDTRVGGHKKLFVNIPVVSQVHTQSFPFGNGTPSASMTSPSCPLSPNHSPLQLSNSSPTANTNNIDSSMACTPLNTHKSFRRRFVAGATPISCHTVGTNLQVLNPQSHSSSYSSSSAHSVVSCGSSSGRFGEVSSLCHPNHHLSSSNENQQHHADPDELFPCKFGPDPSNFDQKPSKENANDIAGSKESMLKRRNLQLKTLQIIRNEYDEVAVTKAAACRYNAILAASYSLLPLSKVWKMLAVAFDSMIDCYPHIELNPCNDVVSITTMKSTWNEAATGGRLLRETLKYCSCRGDLATYACILCIFGAPHQIESPVDTVFSCVHCDVSMMDILYINGCKDETSKNHANMPKISTDMSVRVHDQYCNKTKVDFTLASFAELLYMWGFDLQGTQVTKLISHQMYQHYADQLAINLSKACLGASKDESKDSLPHIPQFSTVMELAYNCELCGTECAADSSEVPSGLGMSRNRLVACGKCNDRFMSGHGTGGTSSKATRASIKFESSNRSVMGSDNSPPNYYLPESPSKQLTAVEPRDDADGTAPILVRCALCQIKVKGLISFCYQCGHGGHIEHMYTWFSEHEECPTGCGCICGKADADTTETAEETFFEFEFDRSGGISAPVTNHTVTKSHSVSKSMRRGMEYAPIKETSVDSNDPLGLFASGNASFSDDEHIDDEYGML